MASRNIVAMQENEGDCIVSRVRKVHQGSPYESLSHSRSLLRRPVYKKLPVSRDLRS